MKESDLQVEIMLAAGRGRSRLLRNNCGVAFFADGSRVRYGVGNPGGSDLIGWSSVTITPEMVGRTLAVFTAIEVKQPNGRVTSDQERFIRIVQQAGGFAGVARSPEDALLIVGDAK